MKKLIDYNRTTIHNHINNIDNQIIKYYSNNETSDVIEDYFKSILNNDNITLENLNFDNITIVNQ